MGIYLKLGTGFTFVGFKDEADYNLIGPLAGSKLSNKFNFPKKIPLTKKLLICMKKR